MMDVKSDDHDSTHQTQRPCVREQFGKAAAQIPAIALIGMFHLMIGIPFGVSYFPIGWSEMGSHDTSTSGDDAVHGSFPVPAKEALGIRMFLLSTLLGQIIFTLKSGFANPIGLQMVENVPFCHALAQVVIRRQGYGTEALSTLMFLFGLSSVIVGIVFMVLGQLNLGRIVYYFPNHVLVGCIAGIGVFLAKTGIEVTIDAVFTQAWDNFHLVVVVLVLEVVLRTLNGVLRDREGKPLYALLSPIYFCLVTPMFYLGLRILNVSVSDATEAGYFFPSLQGAGDASSSIWNHELVTMWTVVDLRTISWPAIVDSIPTLVALTLFSLIHVPINIPAFALTTSKRIFGQ
jgi:SulP family sulfate permease